MSASSTAKNAENRRVAYLYSPELAGEGRRVADAITLLGGTIFKRPIVAEKALELPLIAGNPPARAVELAYAAAAVAVIAVLDEPSHRLEELSRLCASRGILFRPVDPETFDRSAAIDIAIDLQRLPPA